MGRRQRCGAEEGARVEVEPGRGCRAAGVASAGRPRGERALTRSGHDAARQRAGERARRQASALGRAGARRAGAARGFTGPASAVGRETRRRPRKKEMKIFNLYFQDIFKCQLSNIILSKKMTSFENVPKMKVA